MYRRITPKLFNITTRSLKVKVKVVKPRAPSKPKKRERKPKKEEKRPLRAKCPHLRSDKNCARMIKEGLDGNVSDFDIKHFCKGNPILCYYFRLPPPKKK